MRFVKLGPSVGEESNLDLLSGAAPASCSLAIGLHPRLLWHRGPGQPDLVSRYSSFCSGAGSGLASLEFGENRSIVACSSPGRNAQWLFLAWKICCTYKILGLFKSQWAGWIFQQVSRMHWWYPVGRNCTCVISLNRCLRAWPVCNSLGFSSVRGSPLEPHWYSQTIPFALAGVWGLGSDSLTVKGSLWARRKTERTSEFRFGCLC